jgi:hypothetical protein
MAKKDKQRESKKDREVAHAVHPAPSAPKKEHSKCKRKHSTSECSSDSSSYEPCHVKQCAQCDCKDPCEGCGKKCDENSLSKLIKTDLKVTDNLPGVLFVTGECCPTTGNPDVEDSFRYYEGRVVYTATISNESSCEFKTDIVVAESINKQIGDKYTIALIYIDDGVLKEKQYNDGGDVDNPTNDLNIMKDVVIPPCTSVTIIISAQSKRYVDKYRDCCDDNATPIVKVEIPTITVVLYGEFLKPSTTGSAAGPTPCIGKVFRTFSNKH